MILDLRLVTFGLGQAFILLLLATSIICSTQEEEDPQVVKDTILKQFSGCFSLAAYDEYVLMNIYLSLSNFMLDRFEHCDTSFARQPFKTKVDEVSDILQKYVSTRRPSINREQRYRKKSKLDLETLQTALGGIPDEQVAKQYIEYWRLYKLECNVVNRFRKDMKDQYGKGDVRKDVQLLKMFKQHLYDIYWTPYYLLDGKQSYYL